MRHEPSVVVAAAVLVPAYRMSVKMFGLKRTAQVAVIVAGRGRTTVVPCRIDDIACTVDGVSRRLPIGARCLPRSLALWTILRRRGIPTTLHIGLRLDQPREAHAWIDHEGRAVGEFIDEPNIARFPLSEQLPRALVGPVQP